LSKIKTIDILSNKSKPSRQDNDEIKTVPAIQEELTAESNELDGGLNGIDDIENQIDVLQPALQLLGLVVPSQREADRVHNNAQENEVVQDVARGDLVAGVLEGVAGELILDQWLLRVANNEDIAPFSLELSDLVVHVQAFFLSVEDVDDNTDEHVQDEQGAGNHVDHEEENLDWVIVLDLDSVDLSGVDSVPHDSNPAFSCHNVKQGDQALTDVIKVLVLVHPVSSVIKAVILVGDA
jgi:hypothetical protein|tara:strand:- start:3766 stop:4479 length:714 start_codon:yes stop_codon:yes gene_type:complete